ncbi:MAG: MFS transporter [Bacillota bacterium]
MIEQKRKRAYTISLLFLMFIGAVCSSTQGVMLTNYIDYYGLQSSAQGLTSAFQSIGGITALLLIGILVGRVHKSVIIMITAVAVPVVFLTLGSKPPFVVLLISYALYGVAFGFEDSTSSSLMADLYQRRSAVYMNLLHGIYGIGGLVGPILLSSLVNAGLEWNQTLFVIAGLAFLGLIVYAVCGAPIMRSKVQVSKPAARMRWSDVRSFLMEKRKRLLLLAAFLYGAHQIAITGWSMRYISEFLGTPQYGALALSLYWIGITVSRFIAPRFGIARSKIVVFGFVATTLILGAGLASGNGFVMMLCCGLAGIVEGAVLPMLLDMSCSWQIENTSLGSTMVIFVLYIGFILIPPAIGAIAALAGITVGMLTTVVFSVIGSFVTFKLTRMDDPGR